MSRAARHASTFVPADRLTSGYARRESTGWRADVAKRTKADDELQKYRTELARLKRQKERAVRHQHLAIMRAASLAQR